MSQYTIVITMKNKSSENEQKSPTCSEQIQMEVNSSEETSSTHSSESNEISTIEDTVQKISLQMTPLKSTELTIYNNGLHFYLDIFFCFFTIFLYLIDYVFNFFLVGKYYDIQLEHDAYVVYFWLSVGFCLGPPLIGVYFEIVWNLEEKSETGHSPSFIVRCLQFIFAIVLLGPVLKFIFAIIYGFKSTQPDLENKKKEKYLKIMKQERSDAAFLCVIEKFMEASLHLVHQLCLIRTEWDTEHRVLIDWMEWFKVGICLFIMPYTITLYCSYYRKVKDRNHMYTHHGFVHFTWRLLIISSQALCLALYATSYTLYFSIICTIHYLVCVAFVFIQAPKFFAHAGQWAEYFYRFIISYVFFFTYINVTLEDSYYNGLVYYGFIFIERGLLMCMWSQDLTEEVWYQHICLEIYFALFCFGIALMIIYYLFCHPTRETTKMKSFVGICIR